MKTDNVEVKESTINGLGVFATKDFKKGDIVLKWDLSQQISKEEADSLSSEQKKYITLLNNKYTIMQEPENRVNHSCSPNTTSKDFCDIASRDIKKGEEITGNYNEVVSGGPKIKCNCGSPNCCGFVQS